MNGILRVNTSLGRDSHEGQVIPDRQQATIRTKNFLKTGTRNVRTMSRKRKAGKCEDGNREAEAQCVRSI